MDASPTKPSFHRAGRPRRSGGRGRGMGFGLKKKNSQENSLGNSKNSPVTSAMRTSDEWEDVRIGSDMDDVAKIEEIYAIPIEPSPLRDVVCVGSWKEGKICAIRVNPKRCEAAGNRRARNQESADVREKRYKAMIRDSAQKHQRVVDYLKLLEGKARKDPALRSSPKFQKKWYLLKEQETESRQQLISLKKEREEETLSFLGSLKIA